MNRIPQSTYILKSSHSGVVVIGGIDFHRINIGKRRIVKFLLANTNNKDFIIHNLYLQQPINESSGNSYHGYFSSNSTSGGSKQPPFSIVSDYAFPIVIPPNKDFESFISFIPPYPGRFTALLTITSEDFPSPRVQQITLNGEGELQSTPTQIIYTDNQLPIVFETPAKRIIPSPTQGGGSGSEGSSSTWSNSGYSERWPSLPYFDDDLINIEHLNNIKTPINGRVNHNQHNGGYPQATPSPNSGSSSSSQHNSSKKVRWDLKDKIQEYNINTNGMRPDLTGIDGINYEKEEQENQEIEEKQDPKYKKNQPTPNNNPPYNNIDNRFQQFEKKLLDLTKRVEESNSKFNSFVSDSHHHHHNQQNNRQPLSPMYNNNQSQTYKYRSPILNGGKKQHEHQQHVNEKSKYQIPNSPPSQKIIFSQEDMELLEQMKPNPIKFETPKPWKKFLDNNVIDDSLINFKYNDQTPSRSQNHRNK